MKRLLPTSIILLALFGVPLVARPSLLLHAKILGLMAIFAVLWLSQPTLSSEHQRRTATDRGSVWIILALSFPAIATGVVHWGYFQEAEQRSAWGLLPLLGLGLMLAGLGLRIAAIRQLGRQFTPTVQIVERHELITSGLYRRLRHPSYTGALACYLGAALWLGSWPGCLVAALCMGAAYAWRIRAEESALSEVFGADYQAYRRRTRGLLPGIW